MIKAAHEESLSPGHARLAARAYNTGRAAFQRDSSSAVTQKVADFELADPDLVAVGLERTTKQASCPNSTDVSAEYKSPPSFLTTQYKQAQAEIEIPRMCENPVEMPRAFSRDGRQACSDVRMLQRKIAELRGMADKMLRHVDNQIVELCHDFRALGAPATATLRKAAQIKQDKGVLAVLNELERRDELLLKSAASKSALLTEKEQLLYGKVTKTAAAVQDFSVATKKLAAVIDSASTQVDNALGPYRQKQDPISDPFFEINQAGVKQANAMRTLLMPFTGAAVGSGAAKTEQTDNVRHYQLALEDPGHDQTLRGLRARTTMEELRASDPTLAGYSPQELVHGFNKIVQTSPEAANHPIYMQAMLRRYLGQGNALDPDDVRANIMGPNAEMAKSRTAPLPEAPEVARRHAPPGVASRASSAMHEAFSNFNA